MNYKGTDEEGFFNINTLQNGIKKIKKKVLLLNILYIISRINLTINL
jgi:hypothetical protein